MEGEKPLWINSGKVVEGLRQFNTFSKRIVQNTANIVTASVIWNNAIRDNSTTEGIILA